jgi:hypothetical protein
MSSELNLEYFQGIVKKELNKELEEIVVPKLKMFDSNIASTKRILKKLEDDKKEFEQLIIDGKTDEIRDKYNY